MYFILYFLFLFLMFKVYNGNDNTDLKRWVAYKKKQFKTT